MCSSTNNYLKALFLLLLAGAFYSCENPNDVGLELEDNTLQTLYTDTVTVNVSTVLLDSIVTSGSGTMLVGQFQDELMGKTTASSYAQVELGDSWTVEDDAEYDSIKLIMPYSGYSYGDTAQWLTIEVHKLLEEVSLLSLPPYVGTEEPQSYFYSSSALYNTSQLKAEEQPLSVYAFQPRPSRTDSLMISLPDALGTDWMSLKKANDSKLTISNNFMDYFKGIKINPAASGESGSIIGFNLSNAFIRLYYKETSGGIVESLYHDFPLASINQYNQLTGDYSQSVLAGLERGGEPLSSSASSSVGIAQSGTGLMIKLEFPYLEDLQKAINSKMINMAVLQVVPVVNTNRYPYLLPTTLALYETDKTNVPLSPLYMDYSTTQQTATYQADEEYDMASTYQFGITEYFSELFEETETSGRAILLAPSSDSFTQSVDRIVVGGSGHTSRVKLKLYYTLLNNN
ncbi:DUF4270 family protein [Pontibacter silvestris]|uniref:DUF4270 family protein n=1 Tax=Pontibacter silvestris TaxID=2305183 RepID=A0ABW4X2H4_9BACT|nr:DUF4270 family protein [Pontibacter silvestris]MCC9136091.1 DUF4270 domain-containing protein [Pontibacter silvestris]